MSKVTPLQTPFPGDGDGPLTLRLRSLSPRDTQAIGEAVAGCARAEDVITLDGELGAGKTQFVRGLARGLQLDPAVVSSPTFVLSHEYERDPSQAADPPGGIELLVHIDAYRLEGGEGLSSMGWDVSTFGAELRQAALVVIEWGRRVRSALGVDPLEIRLEHAADDCRDLSILCPELWVTRGLKARLTPWITPAPSEPASRQTPPSSPTCPEPSRHDR